MMKGENTPCMDRTSVLLYLGPIITSLHLGRGRRVGWGFFSFIYILLPSPPITPTTPRLEFPINKEMRGRREKKKKGQIDTLSHILPSGGEAERVRVCECVRVHATMCVT